MLVYFCEKCNRIIPEDSFQKEGVRRKNGTLTCTCQEKSQRETLACERCQKAFASKEKLLQSLLSGESVLVGSPEGKQVVYCGRCKNYALRKSRETSDLKFLAAIFIIFLGIPFFIASSINFFNYLKEKQTTGSTRESSKQLAEILQPLQQELLELKKEMARRQGENKETTQIPSQSKQIPESLPESSTTQQPQQTQQSQQTQQQPEQPPTSPKKEETTGKQISQLLEQLTEKKLSQPRKQLTSSSSQQKLSAIIHIAHTRNREGIPLLEEALDDSNPLVRTFAAQTLGALGAKQSIERLFSSLSDPDPVVRKAVAQALTLLTTEKFVFYEDLTEKERAILEKKLRELGK